MLRVHMASGEIVATLSLDELRDLASGADLPVRALKRYLQDACGQPRFRQRLLLEDGTVVGDECASLDLPAELQLVLLQFRPGSVGTNAGLMGAARLNDAVTAERLLQRPQDPDCISANVFRRETTPLVEACTEGSVEVVRLLLEAKADKDRIDDSGRSPLTLACKHRQYEVATLLLKAGAHPTKHDLRGFLGVLVQVKLDGVVVPGMRFLSQGPGFLGGYLMGPFALAHAALGGYFGLSLAT